MTAETLSDVILAHGGHNSRADGMCAMEAVAYIAGEPHSDRPLCASEVITELAIQLNDGLLTPDRQRLKDVIPKIVGTYDSRDGDRMNALWSLAVQKVVPATMREHGFENDAKVMEDFHGTHFQAHSYLYTFLRNNISPLTAQYPEMTKILERISEACDCASKSEVHREGFLRNECVINVGRALIVKPHLDEALEILNRLCEIREV